MVFLKKLSKCFFIDDGQVRARDRSFFKFYIHFFFISMTVTCVAVIIVVRGAHVFDNHGLLTKYYLPGNSTRTHT